MSSRTLQNRFISQIFLCGFPLRNLPSQQSVPEFKAWIASLSEKIRYKHLLGSLNVAAGSDEGTGLIEQLSVNLYNIDQEEAPLVAALVQRGLLKTEDVLSKPYVEAMGKKLREQQLTKEVQGRDVRYRTARAAYGRLCTDEPGRSGVRAVG